MEHNTFNLISIILLISVYESTTTWYPEGRGSTTKCSTLPTVEKGSLHCICSSFQRCNLKCLAGHEFLHNQQKSEMAVICRNGNWLPQPNSKCVLSEACKIKLVGAAEVKCKATRSSYRCHITCTSTKRSKTSSTYVCNEKTRTWYPNLPSCAIPKSYSLNYLTEASNRHPIKQQNLLQKYSPWGKSNRIGKLKNRHPMKIQISHEKLEEKRVKNIAEDIAKKISQDKLEEKRVKSIAEDIAKEILKRKHGKIGETDRLKNIKLMKIQLLPDKAGGTYRLSDKYGKERMKSIAEDFAKKIVPDKYGITRDQHEQENNLKNIYFMKIQVLQDKAGGKQLLSDKYGKEEMKSIAEDIAKKILPDKHGKIGETERLKNIYMMKIQVLHDKAGGTQRLSDKYGKGRMKSIAEDFAKKIAPENYGKTRETRKLENIYLMKIQVLQDKAGGKQLLSDKYGKEEMKSIAKDIAKKILPD